MMINGEALRTEAPPRPPALCARVRAKHSPPHELGLFLVLSLVLAATFGGCVALFDGKPSDPSPVTFANWIRPAAIAGGVALLWFVRFAILRRRRMWTLARDGIVTPVHIVSVGSTWMVDRWFGRTPGSVVVIWVALDDQVYRATVPAGLDWVQPGVAIGLITAPRVPFALFLSPDGKDFLGRESWMTVHELQRS